MRRASRRHSERANTFEKSPSAGHIFTRREGQARSHTIVKTGFQKTGRHLQRMHPTEITWNVGSQLQNIILSMVQEDQKPPSSFVSYTCMAQGTPFCFEQTQTAELQIVCGTYETIPSSSLSASGQLKSRRTTDAGGIGNFAKRSSSSTILRVIQPPFREPPSNPTDPLPLLLSPKGHYLFPNRRLYHLTFKSSGLQTVHYWQHVYVDWRGFCSPRHELCCSLLFCENIVLKTLNWKYGRNKKKQTLFHLIFSFSFFFLFLMLSFFFSLILLPISAPVSSRSKWKKLVASVMCRTFILLCSCYTMMVIVGWNIGIFYIPQNVF